MPPVRVLIVDPSGSHRRLLGKAMEAIPGVAVAAYAANGREALSHLDTTPVDLITLELSRPFVDGFETLQALQLRARRPKVIVISGASAQSAEATARALGLGADDFFVKAEVKDEADRTKVLSRQLLDRLSQLWPLVFRQVQFRRGALTKKAKAGKWPQVDLMQMRPKAVVIAASTGGPPILNGILSSLRCKPSVPIFIVQHMPGGFTKPLAERLSKSCKFFVSEAEIGQLPENGIAYVAPGDFHMILGRNSKRQIAIELSRASQRNFVRPSADFLFESAAKLWGADALAIVLTGMGSDGRDGCVAIKAAGGAVMIQDQVSCAVYGMPKSVEDAEAFDESGDPEFIGKVLGQAICPL